MKIPSMPRYMMFKIVGLLLMTTRLTNGQFDVSLPNLVSEQDTPLSKNLTERLEGGYPVLEIVNLSYSYTQRPEKLYQNKDFLFFDFVAGNPNSTMTFEEPGLQVKLQDMAGSIMVVCFRSYTNCGSSYNDESGGTCKCKDISKAKYKAVRVKGYRILDSRFSFGFLTIEWEETIDTFMYPDESPGFISTMRQLPQILVPLPVMPIRAAVSGESSRVEAGCLILLLAGTVFIIVIFSNME